MVWAFFNLNKASNVALTTLWGFEEPCDFDNTSLTPTASRTVLTAPPAITPVPGGVGPMTIACLLKNTLECFKARLI